jgi:hypothetical protein
MTDDKPKEETISEEFRMLAQNLMEVMRAAWERPERKAFQQEVVNGLNELGITLREGMRKFDEGPAGQRIRTRRENVRERLHSRDDQARKELVNSLHAVNIRLRQAAEQLSTSGSEKSPGTEQEDTQAEGSAHSPAEGSVPQEQKSTGEPHTGGVHEIHPDDVDAPPGDTGRQEIHPDDLEP